MIIRIFINALSTLPKRAGAHYKIDLNTLGLEGFANLYFVAPGMGGVFYYDHPLTSEEPVLNLVQEKAENTECTTKTDSPVTVTSL